MSLSSFVAHIKTSISTWWQSHNPGAVIKHAVDTINAIGVTEPQLEAIAREVIAINGAQLSGLDKAVRVAEQVVTWTGDLALSAPAKESLHVVISLVHLIAKLSGKI